MGDSYAENRCRDCDDDLFMHSGQWYCPTCDNVESFTLDTEEESFEL